MTTTKQPADTTIGLKMKKMPHSTGRLVNQTAMKLCSNKNCPSKGKLLPLSKFYKRKEMKDGHESRCIECRLEYDRKRFQTKGDAWLKVIIG